MNTWSYAILAAIAASCLIQWLLTRRQVRHVRAHRVSVPAAFAGRISLADHQKAADYSQAKAILRLWEHLLGILILLGWTLGGGLQLLDAALRAAGLGETWTGTVFMLAVFAIVALLELPLDIYRTFVLEQRFGFNKTTIKTFIGDLAKSALVFLALGTPLIVLVLWLMANGGRGWWLYVWLTWLGFSLFMMWAYPVFIAPLFNKFRPLADESLRARIEALLKRNGFASQGIYVMDGSSRSTHGNAYFTGLGSNKRIVFFDTLLDELDHGEIEAVLAHELGHFKCRHIVKRIAILSGLSLVALALLGWLVDQAWFYAGLGVATPSPHTALTLFVLIAPLAMFFLQPLFSHISRQHEFEADDFAAAQAQTRNLIQALVKLYKENANTLTPDPLYSAFHDSHPPAPIRISHLETKTA
jgi:STE24 endopeptidase